MLTKKIYILHGWAIGVNNQAKWQPLINQLSAKKYDVEFLKVPGLSTGLDVPWVIQDYVDWLKRQLPVKGRVNIVGHSFGGHVAIRFVAQNPDKINKLILIDSAGLRDVSYFSVVKRKIFLLLSKIGKPLSRCGMAKKLFCRLSGAYDYYGASNVMKKTLQNVVGDEVIEDFSKLMCPTLLIWGGDDTVTPVENAKIFKRCIKNSILKIVSGARHSPQFTHTAETVVLIDKFIRGI